MTALSTSQTVYKERLLPKIQGLLPLVLLIPSFWLVLLPFSNTPNALIAGSCAFFAAIALRLVATKSIIVTNHDVRLGTKTIPIDAIESVEFLDKHAIRRVMGPESNASALHFFASSATFALKLTLKQNQACPYAIVSTNKPDRLKNSLGF